MRGKKSRHIQAIAGGILILSGLLASGCHKKEDILSEKEMVDLIVDLKLAEAYANTQLGGANSSERRTELAKSVLEEHGVSQEKLDSTLGWYGKNLDKYADLYQKVDKRLLEKRKRLMQDSENVELDKEGDNLWPYEKNGVISSLGNSDGWIISLSSPDLQPGDRLNWTMHLNHPLTPLIGILGVEYSDGTSEAVTTHFVNRNQIDLSLQTDTGKTAQRVYGSMRLKTAENMPLFADSIALRRHPYDSLEYMRFRSQKRYGYPVRITKEDRKRKLIADSLRQDSIKKANQLRRDSISRLTASAKEDTINKLGSSFKKIETKDKDGRKVAPRRPGETTKAR